MLISPHNYKTMEVYIHFIELNSDFSRDIADQFHNGKESEDNIMCTWEDELKVAEDVVDFKIKNKTTYTLEGSFSDESHFKFEIPDMTVCECTLASGTISRFAVSSKLIKKTEKKLTGGGNKVRFYFYLRDNLPSENPFPGVYILSKDFPKELKG
jgi:hypothetical protein